MNWKLSTDQRTWEYLDAAGAVVDSLEWCYREKCYIDFAGGRVGENFDQARRAVESGHKPAPKQGRLAL